MINCDARSAILLRIKLEFLKDIHADCLVDLSNVLPEICSLISGFCAVGSLSHNPKSKMGFSMLNFTTLLPVIWKRKPHTCEQGAQLFTLPPEILQHISNFLPLNSVVSLLLCTRKYLWLLGDQALHSLRSAHQIPERKLFLTLLEKDLPDWLLCHHCTLFHPVPQDDGHGKVRYYYKEPDYVRASGLVYITIEFNIRYEHAQLLMNHYRFGRAYQINLKRMSDNLTMTRGDTNIKNEIWSRIVVGELLVRVKSKMRLSSSSDLDSVRFRIPEICPHLRGLYQKRYRQPTMLCPPCRAGMLPCVECSKRKSCQKCSTWFQVTGRELEKSRTEIQIDVWRYLGTCETPFDAKWRSQVCSITLY